MLVTYLTRHAAKLLAVRWASVCIRVGMWYLGNSNQSAVDSSQSSWISVCKSFSPINLCELYVFHQLRHWHISVWVLGYFNLSIHYQSFHCVFFSCYHFLTYFFYHPGTLYWISLYANSNVCWTSTQLLVVQAAAIKNWFLLPTCCIWLISLLLCAAHCQIYCWIAMRTMNSTWLVFSLT